MGCFVGGLFFSANKLRLNFLTAEVKWNEFPADSTQQK